MYSAVLAERQRVPGLERGLPRCYCKGWEKEKAHKEQDTGDVDLRRFPYLFHQ